jgi:hypothetical protein
MRALVLTLVVAALSACAGVEIRPVDMSCEHRQTTAGPGSDCGHGH